MVIILSNPLHFQSSPKFEGPESDGPPTRRGEGGQRLDLPTRFRAYTPNMETPYPTPLFFQRKSWFLYLSGRRVEPLARAPHAGLTLAEPRVGPRLLEAFRKPLGRLSRSGGGQLGPWPPYPPQPVPPSGPRVSAQQENRAGQTDAAHLRARTDPDAEIRRRASERQSLQDHAVYRRPQAFRSLPERVFKSPRPHAAASPSAARKWGPSLAALT